MQLFLEPRRQRRVNRVVRNGRRLRKLIITRTQLAEANIEDSGLDAQIRLFEERIERDKEFIRKTAPEA